MCSNLESPIVAGQDMQLTQVLCQVECISTRAIALTQTAAATTCISAARRCGMQCTPDGCLCRAVIGRVGPGRVLTADGMGALVSAYCVWPMHGPDYLTACPWVTAGLHLLIPLGDFRPWTNLPFRTPKSLRPALDLSRLKTSGDRCVHILRTAW